MDWNRLKTVAAKSAETPILDRFADKNRAADFSVTAVTSQSRPSQ